MAIKVCFSHKKVNENGTWKDENQMNEYMLWVKKPVLCAHCDICLQEINVRETIKALRKQEVT